MTRATAVRTGAAYGSYVESTLSVRALWEKYPFSRPRDDLHGLVRHRRKSACPLCEVTRQRQAYSDGVRASLQRPIQSP